MVAVGAAGAVGACLLPDVGRKLIGFNEYCY